MNKILVVEDDKILNRTLSYNLKGAGYDVDSALNVGTAKKLVGEKKYQLVVLDINLPDGDGYEVCKMVKAQQGNAAVIFVTARDMESDMMKGYEQGADDYVTKPFSVAVFQKKVAAIFNRLEKKPTTDGFDDGWLSIDFLELACQAGGQNISLSPKEWKLLKVLVKNKGLLLTRQVLLEKLWDIEGNYIDDHTLTTTLSGLRRKIEREDRQYIQTAYGMGYIWTGGDER